MKRKALSSALALSLVIGVPTATLVHPIKSEAAYESIIGESFKMKAPRQVYYYLTIRKDAVYYKGTSYKVISQRGSYFKVYIKKTKHYRYMKVKDVLKD